jgi:hypothetical protein
MRWTLSHHFISDSWCSYVSLLLIKAAAAVTRCWYFIFIDTQQQTSLSVAALLVHFEAAEASHHVSS